MTADEVAEIERKQAEGGDEGVDVSATPAKLNNLAGPSSGSKRKADQDDPTPSKKAKTQAASEEEDDEEEDAEEDG